MPESSELKEGQCSACGQINSHEADCPVTKVVITDKREEKRKEAESKRRLEEAATALRAEELAAGKVDVAGHEQEPPPVLAEGDRTARQLRIEELTTKGREDQLTQEEAGELLRLQAAEEQNLDEQAQVHPAVTAFLVILNHDGTIQATHDVNLLMSLERLATVDDMDAGCHVVQRDIQASMTAKQVVFGMQVSAQAMQQQARAAQAMQGINLGGRRGR